MMIMPVRGFFTFAKTILKTTYNIMISTANHISLLIRKMPKKLHMTSPNPKCLLTMILFTNASVR